MIKLLKYLLSQPWRLLKFFVRIFQKPSQHLTRRQAWVLWWIDHLPQHGLSRLAGCLANLEQPVWLKNFFINKYQRRYKISLKEALEENPEAYPSFNAFFSRPLKPEARIIATKGCVSPVDGTVSQAGEIADGQLFQAKGKHYDLTTLLGGNKDWAKKFAHGQFATFYLSPRDYHRVHMPCSGKLLEMIHVPGRLLSVQPSSVAYKSELFARNERVIAIFETEFGPMAVIMIGAIVVGSISTVWCGEVTPPRAYDVYSWPYADAAPTLQRGELMGHFQLGSAVIVLLGERQLRLLPELKAGAAVKFGELMAE